mgnify:CR=1 FL=1
MKVRNCTRKPKSRAKADRLNLLVKTQRLPAEAEVQGIS